MRLHAIFPAAGHGVRMGKAASLPKALIPLHGIPMLIRSLRAIEAAVVVDQAVVAVPPDHVDAVTSALAGQSRAALLCVLGGATREESVHNAFLSLQAAPEDLVIIHDADRPLVEPELVKRVVDRAAAEGAAICAVGLTDTLKEVAQDGHVIRTHPRERFYLAQTPQVFRHAILDRAYSLRRRFEIPASDEAAIVEQAGFTVHVLNGSLRNIKVTFPQDLDMVDRWIGTGA
ncbi:MAG: 2-C-methyl-D-erythritol 4-phosphate cytidylyltransferase [Acidobacteriota bacterium]